MTPTSRHPTRYLIRRMLREHVRPYRRYIFIAVICMIVIASATATNAWMMQPMLDTIFIEKDRRMLLLIPLAILAVSVASAAANYGNILCMRYLGQRVVADMQVRLFGHLMISDIGLFQQESSGRLISRFTHDISLMRNAFSNILTSIAKESLSLIFLIGVMVYQNGELTLVAIPVFFIAVLPIMRLSKRLRKISDRAQIELGDFSSTLDEVFRGVRTVKAYGREQFEISRAQKIIENLFTLYFKSARVQAAASPMMEILSGAAIALVIWYGGSQVLNGTATPGAFFSFMTALLMAYRPLRALAGISGSIQEGLAAANRIFHVLDQPVRIASAPNAPALEVSRGEIQFDQVSFHYDETSGVQQISLQVPAGKKAALVGLSGGGKSTLMNLLLRFYEVESGHIRIDGQDIRSVSLESLRAAMAFVPQEPMLFDDSVRANIAYGRLGATQEEIIEAAKAAAAHEFILQLPQGYDTIIGPHGTRLSGGQRQRLTIARAMLKNAPILLLDEATSALDNESERSIQDALGRLMHNRTTLIIAHRLSTIVNADVIYVIAGGQVLESGTHESLMAKRGAYFQLYAEADAI